MKTARVAIAGKVVVPRLLVAARMGERMRGLLGRATLPVGTGMLLKPCSSIHTVGMRFSLDVIFLDRQNRVVRTISALRPNRFGWGGHGAHTTVECSAGWFDMASLSRGDLLEILF